MNVFQLIKSVLDESYNEIPGTEAERDKAVKEQLEALSEEYTKLTEQGSLDYSLPARRFAYIYCYTTCHANLVYNAICRCSALGAMFNAEQLKVACIGGGPGSDFLGILKYCLRNNKRPRIKCQILDRDVAWSESWADVDDKIGASLPISTSQHPLDVSDESKWRTFKKHFDSDFFTLIYFMSEVFALREQAEAYFAELFSRPSSGSKMLFVDNNSNSFVNWFDHLCHSNGWRQLYVNAGTIVIDYSEEKTDLEPYYSKFASVRPPRTRANTAIRVVEKK